MEKLKIPRLVPGIGECPVCPRISGEHQLKRANGSLVVIGMSRVLKRYCSWAVAAAMLLCPQFLQAQSANVSALSLRDYGWEPPDPHHHSADRPSIAIDHENRILVGFTVQERSGLVTRAQPSLNFRIIRLSPDGKPDLSLSLPTNAAGRTAIYLADNDQIIARANDSIQLLERSKTNPQEAVWKTLAPCASRCLIEQSNSHHTLLLYTAEGDPVTLVRLSQQPEVKRCEKATGLTHSTEDRFQNYPQSITDEFAYFSNEGKTYRWPLCDYAHRVEMPLDIYGRWTVLNDNVFVANPHNASKDQSGLEVISSEGQVKYRWAMEKHETADTLWVPIRSSERGDRIAVDVPTLRGGNRTLDISDHVTARRIAVYDIEAGKEVASVPVNAKHRYRYEFDLSPDGRRLAILEDDTVKVVDLVQNGTGDKPTKSAETGANPKTGNLHLEIPIPAATKNR